MRYVSLPGAPARTLTAQSPGFRAAFGLPNEFDWLAPPLPADLAKGNKLLRPAASRPSCSPPRSASSPPTCR
jgi:hypothetical protein